MKAAQAAGGRCANNWAIQMPPSSHAHVPHLLSLTTRPTCQARMNAEGTCIGTVRRVVNLTVVTES